MRRRISQDMWVLLALLIFVGALGAYMGKRETEKQLEILPVRTTYSASRAGLMALYETLDRLGYRVSRQLQPLTSPPPDGVLFIASPTYPPISTEECIALEKWVSKGNLLIVSDDDMFDSLASGKKAGGRSTQPTCPSFLSRNARKFRTDYKSFISGNSWGFHEIGYLPEKTDKKGNPVPHPSRPLASLFGDSTGTSIGYCSWGKGGVLIVAGSWSLSNRGISEDDNLILVLNAIARNDPSGKPVVTFDEYHHGYGHEPGLISLVGTPARAGLAQLGMAFLLLVFAVSRRFGRPVPLREGARQRGEYLASMSSLLRRAHAGGVVKSELERKFLDDMAVLLGLPPNSEAEEILSAAQGRWPDKVDDLRKLIEPARASPDEALDEGNLLTLEIRRDKFRKEMAHGK